MAHVHPIPTTGIGTSINFQTGHARVPRKMPLPNATRTSSPNGPLASYGRSKWTPTKPNYEPYFSPMPRMGKLCNDFLARDMSLSMGNPGLQRRASVKDYQATYEILVDVHDYAPDEIKVQIVNGGASVLVKGEHNSGLKPKLSRPIKASTSDRDEGKKSESRSFSEKYSFPLSVDRSTIKWQLGPGGRLSISGTKYPPHNNNYSSFHSHRHGYY